MKTFPEGHCTYCVRDFARCQEDRGEGQKLTQSRLLAKYKS